MRQLLFTAMLALTAVACSGSSEDGEKKPDKEKPDKSEPGAVRIGKVGAKVPKDWKEERPKSSMRAYQFRLPGVGGADDAELLVFRLGGTAKQNVERWQKQFTPPEGKKREDAIKVTEVKLGSYPALSLDAQGTYNSGLPSGPQGPQKDFRMLAVAIDVPDKPAQIILRGPAKTVEKYKKGFDDWLKAFK